VDSARFNSGINISETTKMLLEAKNELKDTNIPSRKRTPTKIGTVGKNQLKTLKPLSKLR